ncbi:Protein of unknown function [Pyronema omphalodes CBS 100304]|uniref:Uncharacterized protein n=1 Tax=Pyronema omphalodes (strain CBS 100304) TaxID=1076935 RepID=U4KUN7_PYROM|nr:Protein of unknown function [Pyronema omphalodes CBS 100304]
MGAVRLLMQPPFPYPDKKAEEMREHLDMLPCFFGPGDGDRVLKGLRNAAGVVLNDKAWRDSIPLREHLQRVQMLANRRCNSASEIFVMDCFRECKAILQCLIAVFDEDPDQAISVMQLRDHTEYFFLLMVVANSEGFAAHRKEIVDIIEKYAKKLFEEVDATDGVPVMDTKFNEKDWSTAFLPNNGN